MPVETLSAWVVAARLVDAEPDKPRSSVVLLEMATDIPGRLFWSIAEAILRLRPQWRHVTVMQDGRRVAGVSRPFGLPVVWARPERAATNPALERAA